MKKTVALFTVLALVFSLSACGDKTASQAEIHDTTSVEETTEEESEETSAPEISPEETPTPEISPEEAPTPEISPEKEPSPEEKLQSALGEMPYYGDAAKCAMTAEQATAYAQLIADGLAGDFSFRGGYDNGKYSEESVYIDILTWASPFKVVGYDGTTEWPEETDRANVMLADFAGDGNPYLYVYSSSNESSFEIYGWRDDNAELVFHAECPRTNPTYTPEEYSLREDDSDEGRMKILCTDRGSTMFDFSTYSFSDGTIAKENTSISGSAMFDEWHVYENGTETGVYTSEEISLPWDWKDKHTHTLPYTCFYDMNPCTLVEMVNDLNAYATVMSDGQSVPVEIKKVDIVKHDGTGITTKGEVPQEKVKILDILRKYMVGEYAIECGDLGPSLYTADGMAAYFYFDFRDINNDDTKELILSEKDGAEDEYGYVQIHMPPSYDMLDNVYGFDSTNNTYLVWVTSASEFVQIYTYDGTAFTEVSSAYADDGLCTVTENGTEREVSDEEFWAIADDWIERHTKISSKSVDIHLDIENIENTFQVKIDVQPSGEWIVTGAE